MKLSDLLKKEESFRQEKFLPRSFDVIGKIVLIQIPREHEDKERIIARTLLEQHKNVKAVYAKGKTYGRLRKQKIRWLAGSKILETTYKESGCLFKLNVKTCFFSPRLATDRLDIAKKVKRNERVLVMFSGIAPYGIVIAKNSRAKKVYCIELNRECTKYAKENVLLNKLNNVEIIQGDVKKVVRKLKTRFDRIVMPRPQLEYDFLKEAFLVSKKGTIIHFQDFLSREEFAKKEHLNKILSAAKKARKKIKILKTKILREVAPYRYNIRVDFKVL